jgi:hypothetical protein
LYYPSSWRSFFVSVEYFTIMFTDEIFNVCHTTVTNTDCVAVESLCSLFEGRKCLSIRFRNVCATLVLTFLL